MEVFLISLPFLPFHTFSLTPSLSLFQPHVSKDDLSFLMKEFAFDTKVYQHFQYHFEKMVVDFGKVKIGLFVDQLQEMNKYVSAKCVKSVQSVYSIKKAWTR